MRASTPQANPAGSSTGGGEARAAPEPAPGAAPADAAARDAAFEAGAASLEVRILHRDEPAEASVSWSGGGANGWLARGEDGLYRGEVPAGRVEVVAIASGVADARAERTLSRGEHAAVEMRLGAVTVSLGVLVRDEAGEPLRGATVSLTRGGSVVPLAVARTRADGTARLARLAPGQATLLASAPGFEEAALPLDVGARAEPVEVALRRAEDVQDAIGIRGIVIDRAGRPVGSAVVAAFGPGGGGGELARATAGPDGRFTVFISDVPSVELRVVGPPGSETAGRGTLVSMGPDPAGSGREVLVLSGARPRLVLRIALAPGAAAPSRLSLEGLNASTRTGGFLGASALQADGTATFEMDVARYEEIMLRAPGFAPAFLGALDLATGPIDPAPREVALALPARIRGRVAREEGGPIGGAAILARFLLPASGSLSYSTAGIATTSDAGLFEVDGLPSGVALSVEVGGRVVATRDLRDLAPGEVRDVEIAVH